MLNIHIRTPCDTLLCQETTCVSDVNGKGNRVTKGNSKPLETIERTAFQMPWFWIIMHKLKITECEYQYVARKLCSM